MAWLLEAADERNGTDKAPLQPESKHGDSVAVPGQLHSWPSKGGRGLASGSKALRFRTAAAASICQGCPTPAEGRRISVSASPGLQRVTADASRGNSGFERGQPTPTWLVSLGGVRAARNKAYGASEPLTPSQRQADRAAQVSSARHASRESRDKARWRPGANERQPRK